MKFVSATLLCVCALVSPCWAETKPEPPVPVRTVPPEYPANMKQQGVSGVVLIRLTVNADGNVADAAVEKSTNPAFDEPALAALKKWRFKPAQQNGAPVAMKIALPIKFSIDS